MSWWAWILFWILFAVVSVAYLAWRCWRLWPHLRAFGHTVQGALERADAARQAADDVLAASEPGASREVSTQTDLSSLAWNQPASHWRAQWRRSKRRRQELRLDDHAETWASWQRRVD